MSRVPSMIRSGWGRAGLALSLACGDAVGVPPEPLSDTAGALPSCEAQACTALAGPCQVGVCDARTGACRLSAAGEGAPCLEGNVCGPAECRNGECRALGPSQCSLGENEQCRVAVCRPERGGCVSEPLAVPGATCETALPLQVGGQSTSSADSQCGDHTRQFQGCTSGLLGPSAHFSLDLRAKAGATPVAIAIDADFSFEAVLARGPCGDNVLEACATPLQTDGRTRAVSVTLPPAYYELVVTGRSESDQGTVHVAASVGPATCLAATTNDSCDAGLAFDTSLSTQTIISNGACGNLSMPVRCGLQPIGDALYDLDLSSRTAPTLLELDVSRFSSSGPGVFAALFTAEDSGCGEFTMCGSRFTSRLPPGRYRIGVSQFSDDQNDTPVAVRVRLRDADCAATTNATWQTAIELDPNAERQRLSGNTACGSDDFRGACNADHGAPELFYRLDLRSQRAPRQLYFSGASDSDLVAYLLLPDAMGVPSRVAGCQSLSSSFSDASSIGSALFTLAPRLYYFVIDGRVANAGRFDLELQQEDADPVPSDCFGPYLLPCLDDSEPACADSRASPECLSAAVECGLDPAVFEAFCAHFAGCCDGTAPPAECQSARLSNVECN